MTFSALTEVKADGLSQILTGDQCQTRRNKGKKNQDNLVCPPFIKHSSSFDQQSDKKVKLLITDDFMSQFFNDR